MPKTEIRTWIGQSKMSNDDRKGGVGPDGDLATKTKPKLWARIVSQVKSENTGGTAAGKWSARKAQLLAKTYKARGGGYRS